MGGSRSRGAGSMVRRQIRGIGGMTIKGGGDVMKGIGDEVIKTLEDLISNVRKNKISFESIYSVNAWSTDWDEPGSGIKSFDGTFEIIIRCKEIPVDRSEKADAERFRWLLDGNGYFMEEEGLCPHFKKGDKSEQDQARMKIDEAMREDFEDGEDE
jgi:hypothetical protein